MKLFLTHVDLGTWQEHFYAIAENKEEAIEKIYKARYSHITGIKDLDKQKNQVRDNMIEAIDGVDWYLT